MSSIFTEEEDIAGSNHPIEKDKTNESKQPVKSPDDNLEGDIVL